MGCQIGFFYNPIKNLFIDTDGFVVYEIFRFVSPNQLLLFKMKKEDIHFRYKENTICLYWSNGTGLVMNHMDETMDLGDDIERIERYERGKWYMNY